MVVDVCVWWAGCRAQMKMIKHAWDNIGKTVERERMAEQRAETRSSKSPRRAVSPGKPPASAGIPTSDNRPGQPPGGKRMKAAKLSRLDLHQVPGGSNAEPVPSTSRLRQGTPPPSTARGSPAATGSVAPASPAKLHSPAGSGVASVAGTSPTRRVNQLSPASHATRVVMSPTRGSSPKPSLKPSQSPGARTATRLASPSPTAAVASLSDSALALGAEVGAAVHDQKGEGPVQEGEPLYEPWSSMLHTAAVLARWNFDKSMRREAGARKIVHEGDSDTDGDDDAQARTSASAGGWAKPAVAPREVKTQSSAAIRKARRRFRLVKKMVQAIGLLIVPLRGKAADMARMKAARLQREMHTVSTHLVDEWGEPIDQGRTLAWSSQPDTATPSQPLFTSRRAVTKREAEAQLKVFWARHKRQAQARRQALLDLERLKRKEAVVDGPKAATLLTVATVAMRSAPDSQPWKSKAVLDKVKPSFGQRVPAKDDDGTGDLPFDAKQVRVVADSIEAAATDPSAVSIPIDSVLTRPTNQSPKHSAKQPLPKPTRQPVTDQRPPQAFWPSPAEERRVCDRVMARSRSSVAGSVAVPPATADNSGLAESATRSDRATRVTRPSSARPSRASVSIPKPSLVKVSSRPQSARTARDVPLRRAASAASLTTSTDDGRTFRASLRMAESMSATALGIRVSPPPPDTPRSVGTARGSPSPEHHQPMSPSPTAGRVAVTDFEQWERTVEATSTKHNLRASLNLTKAHRLEAIAAALPPSMTPREGGTPRHTPRQESPRGRPVGVSTTTRRGKPSRTKPNVRVSRMPRPASAPRLRDRPSSVQSPTVAPSTVVRRTYVPKRQAQHHAGTPGVARQRRRPASAQVQRTQPRVMTPRRLGGGTRSRGSGRRRPASARPQRARQDTDAMQVSGRTPLALRPQPTPTPVPQHAATTRARHEHHHTRRSRGSDGVRPASARGPRETARQQRQRPSSAPLGAGPVPYVRYAERALRPRPSSHRIRSTALTRGGSPVPSTGSLDQGSSESSFYHAAADSAFLSQYQDDASGTSSRQQEEPRRRPGLNPSRKKRRPSKELREAIAAARRLCRT